MDGIAKTLKRESLTVIVARPALKNPMVLLEMFCSTSIMSCAVILLRYL